jgi:hypothetical protein
MLIDQNIASSTFIRAFARPIDLDSMPAGVLPTYIAVDVSTLKEQLFDEPDGMRLVRRIGDDSVVLEKNEVDAVLALLDRTLTVRRVRGGELRITDPQNHQIGILNIGKTRISTGQAFGRKCPLPSPPPEITLHQPRLPIDDSDGGCDPMPLE